jgi:DNA-binding NtrC family response regulator
LRSILTQPQNSNLTTAPNNHHIRILHVDDDSSMLKLSKQVLADMGSFEIDHAGCVDEAFQKLSSGRYDVVVSDYEMPKKDGLEFLKELRDQNNTIPFILFTGKGREEVAIKTFNFGADAYINKQGNPEIVYGELANNIQLSFASKKAKANTQEQNLVLKNNTGSRTNRIKLGGK